MHINLLPLLALRMLIKASRNIKSLYYPYNEFLAAFIKDAIGYNINSA
jgi:hypothetical protein